MTIGPVLDRLCFWNAPGWLASYQLPVPHQTIQLGDLEVWHIPGDPEAPSLLFCHGNAGNLRFPNVRRDRLLAIHATGVNLWAFDYRGYGRSTGSPTEQGVYDDASSVYSLARSHHNPESPFILFGRSLGGAVATYLATEVLPPELLILESTFTSAPDVCRSWGAGPLADQMSHHFASKRRISELCCPCRMIHGTRDLIVPYRLGRELYDLCPTDKEFVSVEGAGHNNLQQRAGGEYERTLQRWLSEPSSGIL